jgi:hypothetical protein
MPRGDVTFGELRDSYYGQARALVEGGVDLLLFETAFDTRNVKAGLIAVQKLAHDLGLRILLMLSATIERSGTMVAGQAVDAWWASITHADLVSVGVNCATGPDLITDPIRTLAQMATTRISCHSNAGLPDTEGHYLGQPISELLRKWPTASRPARWTHRRVAPTTRASSRISHQGEARGKNSLRLCGGGKRNDISELLWRRVGTCRRRRRSQPAQAGPLDSRLLHFRRQP